jgi:hypothetical protein
VLPLSYFPDASVKHDDWEVAAVGTFTLAAGVAGRAGVFSFRNGSYAKDPVYSGLTYDMLFVGGGVGVDIVARFKGAKEGGQSKPSGLLKKWHPIHCDRPFSAMDLSGSSGGLHPSRWRSSTSCSFPRAIQAGACLAVSRLPDLDSVLAAP